MKKDQEKLKAGARKAAIRTECDKYSNKVRGLPLTMVMSLQATKRSLKVLMVAMDFVKDIEEVWSDLAKKDEEGEGIAREDNLEEVNNAIDSMTTIVTKLGAHLQWEFDMNVSASESKVGWGVVSQAEISKKKEEEGHKCTVTPEQIRKWEVEKMTYDRQLRLAGAGGGWSGGGDKSMGSVAAWDNVWMDGHAPRGGARGRGKRNRSSSSHTGGGGRGRGAAQEGGRGRGGRGILKCYR